MKLRERNLLIFMIAIRYIALLALLSVALPVCAQQTTIKNLKVTNSLRITAGTPGAGKLLQSDANGNATWQTVSTGSGSRKRLAIWATDSILTSNVNFYADSVANSIGIGTVGISSTTLGVKGATNNSAANALQIQNSDATVISNFRNDGRVGINTTTLNSILNIENTAANAALLELRGSSTQGLYFFNGSGSGFQPYINTYTTSATLPTVLLANIDNGSDVSNTTPILSFRAAKGGLGGTATLSLRDIIIDFRNGSATPIMSLTRRNSVLIGTTTDNASSILTLSSTTKGFLPPRMTATEAEAISTPAEGLLIYATDGSGVTITSKGWWGYSGATWEKLNP